MTLAFNRSTGFRIPITRLLQARRKATQQNGTAPSTIVQLQDTPQTAIVQLKCDTEAPTLTFRGDDVRAVRLVRFEIINNTVDDRPQFSEAFKFVRRAYGTDEMQYEIDGELQTDASEAENEQGCHAEHVSGNAKLVVHSESEQGSGTESEPYDDAAAVSASALPDGDAAMTHVIILLAELPATVDLECDVGAISGRQISDVLSQRAISCMPQLLGLHLLLQDHARCQRSRSTAKGFESNLMQLGPHGRASTQALLLTDGIWVSFTDASSEQHALDEVIT